MQCSHSYIRSYHFNVLTRIYARITSMFSLVYTLVSLQCSHSYIRSYHFNVLTRIYARICEKETGKRHSTCNESFVYAYLPLILGQTGLSKQSTARRLSRVYTICILQFYSLEGHIVFGLSNRPPFRTSRPLISLEPYMLDV